MRILLTNDDGIHAEGLAALERIARTLSDDIWIVAPETDQSGLAHSLTLSEPLRLREVSERHYALRGTPTDCVIMAVRDLMDSPPDLVLSGVNAGVNVADGVTYSGTVAGAIEGTLLGIRSIALSQAYKWDDGRMVPWGTTEAVAPELLSKLIDIDLPPGTFLNVNFPYSRAEDIDGVTVTSQGKLVHGIDLDRREDARGVPYYWLRFSHQTKEFKPGTDLEALGDNKISVTPLKLDFTDYSVQQRIAEALG
ncbi:5'/3'-nucleotidase SurE [Hoeflea poritis]|uniref:5'-nucleotidase SurE n=1 Tax=Hoeflea poritis TaxID=2993659 RepID=A0ABT4VPM7_9HYPH|nr:5'/3'-nucleotidase SurE [Hoeflea poritis]MDA4846663.1 5'/3'-nucleotidase SurE [Hoeflea poritis]